MTHYWIAPIDILLNDMGVGLDRTTNWIAEYFGVYRPKRFQSLHEEGQRKAEGRAYIVNSISVLWTPLSYSAFFSFISSFSVPN